MSLRDNGEPHIVCINPTTLRLIDNMGQVIDTLDLSSVTTLTLPSLSVTNAFIANTTITNAKLAVPKTVIYQETVTRAQFTDGGAAVGTLVLAHTIPAGSVFQRSTIHTLVGFTGDTSAALTIGDGSDVDRYNTGTPNVFVTAAAGVDLGVPSGTVWHTAAVSAVTLTVTSAADFTNVSAGSMIVTLFYQRPV